MTQSRGYLTLPSVGVVASGRVRACRLGVPTLPDRPSTDAVGSRVQQTAPGRGDNSLSLSLSLSL